MVIADQPPERTLVLTHVFDASRDTVFAAWTHSDRVATWWPPTGATTISCTMDVGTGGAYRIETSEPNLTRGLYREIHPPEWLIFTAAQDDHQTLVTIHLEPDDRKTRLTLHQAVFETTADRDTHRAAWTSRLQRLAEHLATA
jgi:uncharacterized protein YndB with AHSA1/START domain